MAIDTREKRFSMMTLGDIWQPSVPIPSGAFDQGDRQSLLHGYAGILWESISKATGLLCIAISAIVPGISISSTAPEIALSSTKPDISITDGGNCND